MSLYNKEIAAGNVIVGIAYVLYFLAE